MSALPRATARPSKTVLVFVEDEALRADVEGILLHDGYDVTATSNESVLRGAMHGEAVSVLVVDVSAVSEETLDDLSSEGRVPRIVVFSSVRSGAPSRLPFRAEVLRAAVARAWRADERTFPTTERRVRRMIP